MVTNVSRKPAHARIPSLDGLRAISIGLVLWAHLGGTHGFGTSRALAMIDWATLGVRTFFVLSGFLITGILLTELSHTGTINLRRFYYRRTMRIFPAYYALIAAVAVAGRLGYLHLARGDVLAATSYTMNYHSVRGWSLGHTWSLAVEEQFYLLWPATLYLWGARRGLGVALAFVIIAPLIRIALLAMPGGATIGFSFETVADAIAVGCLLAGLRDQLWTYSAYRALVQSWRFILVPIAIGAALAVPQLEADRALGLDRVWVGIYNLVGITVINVGLALCIDAAIRNHTGPVGRILNARPIMALGVMSYSIYLWQQPFLNRNVDRSATRFPLNLVLTLVCAALSYYLVERVTLRFRDSTARTSRT